MAKILKSLTRPLADVNVLPQKDGTHEIVVCFMPDPEMLVGEGNSKACLALDASLSLKKMYGGQMGSFSTNEPNYVEAVAQGLGRILCAATKSGKVNGVYWAVSQDGSKIEDFGTYDESGWGSVKISGPQKEKWGRGTRILPVIKHCVENVGKGFDLTFGVIITDGIIEDEQDATTYCLTVGKEMATGKRKPVKLILIGIGEEVDEGQLERFDDMFEGSGIDYDLWSHGMVASMKDEADIMGVLYGELIDEDTPITSSGGRVEDSKGRELIAWADGMPGKFRFILPKGEKKFFIRTPNQDIEQDCSEVIKP